MGRYASDSGTFNPAPPGTHVARCYQIVDIGTQHGEWQGKPTVRNQVVVFWELPLELMDDGKPYIVSKFYTNSLSEKANLYGDLISWRGRDFTAEELAKFDLEKIIGAPCMIAVVQKEGGKSVVSAISALPKGMECPPLVNERFSFWLDEFSQEKFDKLSDGLKNLIMKSDEYKAMMGNVTPIQKAAGQDFDDEVPF